MKLYKHICLFLVVLLTFSASIGFAEDSEETETEAEDIEELTLEEEAEESAEPEYEVEDDVIILTESNFESVALTKEIILVEFYAPWCGHCKRLAPEYAKAAGRLKQADPPVPLAKVDATEHQALGSKYGVTGYPTLKIFRNGEVHDFDGPRDEEGIVQYMKEQSDPSWEPPPSAVVILTEESFDEIVNDSPLVLVEFYAPWCGHCKKIAPEYEKAALGLLDEDPPIVLAKVDATEQKDLATRFGVTGYPTLKIFRHGNEFEYKGPREAAGIIDYMKKQSGDSSEHFETLKELKKFLSFQEDVSIVGFFDSEDHPLYRVYLDAGNSLREEYRFSHTFLSEARDTYKVNPNSVVLFIPKRFQSRYEPKRYVYSEEEPNTDALMAFYDAHDIPLVGQLTRANSESRYMGRPILVVYYGVDWSFDHRVDTEFWREKVLEVAKDKEFEDITFVIADEEEFVNQMKELELDDSGEEINVGLFDTKKQRFKMEPDDEFDSDSLREFVRSWREGELKPVIKSQPKPKKNNGPVKIVTGRTFEEIVLDDSKDVLLEIYAPWCGHCKQLEPDYKKLGKKFKGSDKVVIAKIDGTANDIPSPYIHSGFPTLYLAKANDKENPVKFEGRIRAIEPLTEFIEENSSFPKEKDEL